MRYLSQVRYAGAPDIPQLTERFHAMLEECGLLGSGLVADWRDRLARHYAASIAEGSMSWSVIDDGEQIVATACATLNGGPSIYKEPSATISGVYVLPSHRGRGYARAVTESVLAWCRGKGCASVRLIASPMGRPLYESLGFIDGAEMRLKL